jgi:hypothetical protein
MESSRAGAAAHKPLAFEAKPSLGDKPCVESAEDVWPLRCGVLVVAAAICVGLVLLV